LPISRTHLITLGLVLMLLFAFSGPPVRVVNARVENARIEWLVDDPNYKEAIVHVTMHNGTYNVLVKANITYSGSETIVNITASLNPEGSASWVSVAIPDVLYDAPYTSEPVPAFHIHFPPGFATALRVVLLVALLVGIFVFFVAFLEMIAADLIALLGHDFFIWASIPWVFLSIFSRDQNVDGSLDLYVPYDEVDLAFLPDSYIIATAISWWRIVKRSFSFLFLSFTWYSAEWLQERVTIEFVNQPPWAWFEWAPTSPYPGETVIFTSTSFDPDGTIENYRWWFGDGFEAYGETVTHVYSHPGYYNVRLQVTDNNGSTSETSTTLMEASFFVIPETTLGTITPIIAMIAALGYCTLRKRNALTKKPFV